MFPRPAAVSSDTFQHRGAVAQLGERLLRTQEVIGSIPFSSTKIVNPKRGREAALSYCGVLTAAHDDVARLLVRRAWIPLSAGKRSTPESATTSAGGAVVRGG
jgi:hypothetical protein